MIELLLEVEILLELEVPSETEIIYDITITFILFVINKINIIYIMSFKIFLLFLLFLNNCHSQSLTALSVAACSSLRAKYREIDNCYKGLHLKGMPYAGNPRQTMICLCYGNPLLFANAHTIRMITTLG
jgi:hypothetical protein